MKSETVLVHISKYINFFMRYPNRKKSFSTKEKTAQIFFASAIKRFRTLLFKLNACRLVEMFFASPTTAWKLYDAVK